MCLLTTFKSIIEQMTQFHRMIYEKWNIKKLSELENTEWMRNENKSLESDKQVSTSNE